MMKTYKYPLGVLIIVVLCFSTSTSRADMFGADDKKWEKVFSDIKKISVRLTDYVDVQLKGLQASGAEVLSQLDKIKNTIPALQGAIEQSDQHMAKMEERVTALEGRIKLQLDEQKKSQQETNNALKQGLATDMDNLAKRNSESQATILANIDTNNKKMLDILAKGLQENQDAIRSVSSFGKNLGDINDQISSLRDSVTKLNLLTKEHGVAQTQTDLNLKSLDEKINQTMLKVDPGMANLDLANQKLSKLIEILKAFAVEQEKLVKTQTEMSNSIAELREKSTFHPLGNEVKKSEKSQKKSSSNGKSKKAAPEDE